MPRVIAINDKANKGRIKDLTGDLIPEGNYHGVRIADVKAEQSKSEKNKGKDLYVVDVEFTDGEHEGRTIRTWVCLWEGAHYSLIQMNKSLGLEAVDGDGNLLVYEIHELIGGDLHGVKVKHEDSNGTTRAVIDQFLFAGKGAKASGNDDKEDVPLAPARGRRR